MKLKATIVALVLGTSSLAMARPATVRGSAGVSVSAQASISVRAGTRQARPPVQNAPRRVVRPAVYHPTVQPSTYQAPQPTYYVENDWVSESPALTVLSNGMRFEGADTKKELGLNGRNSFSKIRIEARGSAAFIQEVRVTFSTGETQTLKVDEVISGRTIVTLDLDGRNRSITRVLVYGSAVQGGAGSSNGMAILAF